MIRLTARAPIGTIGPSTISRATASPRSYRAGSSPGPYLTFSLVISHRSVSIDVPDSQLASLRQPARPWPAIFFSFFLFFFSFFSFSQAVSFSYLHTPSSNCSLVSSSQRFSSPHLSFSSFSLSSHGRTGTSASHIYSYLFLPFSFSFFFFTVPGATPPSSPLSSSSFLPSQPYSYPALFLRSQPLPARPRPRLSSPPGPDIE